MSKRVSILQSESTHLLFWFSRYKRQWHNEEFSDRSILYVYSYYLLSHLYLLEWLLHNDPYHAAESAIKTIDDFFLFLSFQMICLLFKFNISTSSRWLNVQDAQVIFSCLNRFLLCYVDLSKAIGYLIFLLFRHWNQNRFSSTIFSFFFAWLWSIRIPLSLPNWGKSTCISTRMNLLFVDRSPRVSWPFGLMEIKTRSLMWCAKLS